jgi:Domain of unknown function DUF11
LRKAHNLQIPVKSFRNNAIKENRSNFVDAFDFSIKTKQISMKTFTVLKKNVIRKLMATPKVGLIALFLLFAASLSQAATKNATTTGNWSTLTWSPAGVPANSDDVIINNGITVTVDGTITCNSLTFFSKTSGGAAATGNLTINSPNSLTVTRAITVPSGKSDGTFTISGTGTVSTDTLNVNDGKTPAANPTTAYTLTSTLATFNVSHNVNVVGTGAAKFNNPVLNINGGTLTVGGTIVVTSVTGGAATFAMATSTLALSGTTPWNVTTGGTTTITLNGSGDLVNYSGSAQTVYATSYTNLTLSGSGAKTMSTGTAVAGTLNIAGTAQSSVGAGANLSVNSLQFGGITQASGLWGSTSSAAGHQSDTYFVPGTTGVLNVSTPAPGSATKLVITGSTTQTAGVSQNLTLTAEDASGNTATGYTGSKNLTFSGANSSTNPVTAPTVTNSSGTAIAFGTATAITFTSGAAIVSGSNNGVMVLYKAESATISATDGSISSSGSDRLSVTVSATSMNKFALSLTSPQTNGSAFTGTNTLTAQDAYGNTVTSYSAATNNVTIAANSPLTGTVSGLSGGNKLTGAGDFVSGVANLTTLGITYTGNANSGTFTATSASPVYTGTSGSVTINPGAISKLVVTLPGQTYTVGTGNSGTVTAQTAGTALNIVSITATDANFNTVTSYSGAKTISYTGPTGSPTYTTAVSFTSGQSTTTLATTFTKAEVTTITASDGTTTGPASSSLTVNPGAISKLVVTLPGQTYTVGTGNSGTVTAQTAGTAFNIVSITATDANFNTVTSYSGAKTISYTGPTGTPSYTTAVSFTSGQSTTTLATTLTKAEATTITAGDGAITGPASSSLTVNVGTASKLVVTLPGQTFTSGTGNSGTVTAQTAGTAFNITSIIATDAGFNTVTSYSGSKTISYTGPSGTPSYTTAVSFTNGQSTSTLATTLTKAEATMITAGDGTSTGPASSSLTVSAASMNKFAFSLASPQTNAAAFTGTNTLTAQDTYGNTVTTFNASLNNVTITASPADGTITGLGSGSSNVLNQAIDFTSGVANIQNKMIFTGTIGSHTFTATSSTGGYTGTSGSVTINAATYVWNHSISIDWQVANNWTPLRTTATTSDILAFNGGGSVSVTNVPTQTIAQLLLSNSSTVNLQPASSSNGLTVNDVLTTAAGDVLNLGSGIILGGTLTTLTNSGRIQTAVITTTSATPIPASLTWGGTVEYNGSGAQTALGGTYTTLEINNSMGVTLANAATVTTLTMADVTSGSIFNDGGFVVSTATTLNLNSGTYNCSASAFPWGTVNAGTGTVDFNGTGSQTVPGLPYYSLRISGARTTNTVTLSSTDTIHVSGGFTPVATFSGAGGYATTGTIFEYNGSAAQNVAAFTYDVLIMTNGGSNAKTFIGTDSVKGNLVINGNATAAGGSGNVVLFGNWTNNGTFSAGTSTVEFGGVPPTTINGVSTFNTLAINKQDSSTAITLNNNINVGTLTMTKGTVQTGSNSVTITGTRTGNALILGAVTRTHAFAVSTPYAFEGPNTLVNFTAGSTPSSVTVVVVAQTTPASPTMIPVDRSISISTTGGSFTATLRLHYENSETNNLNELGLRLWKDSSGTWLDQGATTRDSVNNYVELTGITAFGSWAIGASASSKTLVDNNGGSVNAGDTLTYTVTIVNPYKSTKPTIDVSDALSSKFILVPGTISNSGAIAGQVLTGMNLEGGTMTWPSFSLAGGASVTRTFQLRSDSTISPSQKIANTAHINYGGGKVEYVSVSVTLTNLPNITITNAVDNTKPVPGDILTYTLSVRNIGTSNATNITLNTAIPNNTTFSANGYGGGLGVQVDGVPKTNASDGDEVTYGGGSITVTISTLGPGTTTQIKFKTAVN